MMRCCQHAPKPRTSSLHTFVWQSAGKFDWNSDLLQICQLYHKKCSKSIWLKYFRMSEFPSHWLSGRMLYKSTILRKLKFSSLVQCSVVGSGNDRQSLRKLCREVHVPTKACWAEQKRNCLGISRVMHWDYESERTEQFRALNYSWQMPFLNSTMMWLRRALTQPSGIQELVLCSSTSKSTPLITWRFYWRNWKFQLSHDVT